MAVVRSNSELSKFFTEHCDNCLQQYNKPTSPYVPGKNLPMIPTRWSEAHSEAVKTGIEIIAPGEWKTIINGLSGLTSCEYRFWRPLVLLPDDRPTGGIYLMSSSAAPDAVDYVVKHDIRRFISVANFNQKKEVLDGTITIRIGLMGKIARGEGTRTLTKEQAARFIEASDTAHKWLVEGKNVGIYCKAGENRSVAFLIWYFMTHLNFVYLESVNFLAYRGVTFDKMIYNKALQDLSKTLSPEYRTLFDMNLPGFNVINFRLYKDLNYRLFYEKLLKAYQNDLSGGRDIPGMKEYVHYMRHYIGQE